VPEPSLTHEAWLRAAGRPAPKPFPAGRCCASLRAPAQRRALSSAHRRRRKTMPPDGPTRTNAPERSRKTASPTPTGLRHCFYLTPPSRPTAVTCPGDPPAYRGYAAVRACGHPPNGRHPQRRAARTNSRTAADPITTPNPLRLLLPAKPPSRCSAPLTVSARMNARA